MKKTNLFLLLFCLALFSGCNSDFSGFTRTETGLYYKFHVKNENAAKPQIGDILTVLLTYRTRDSVLFNSSFLPDAFRFPLDPPGFKGDIFEGLAMMHLGDSATFIVPADSLRRYGNLPPLDTGVMLYFDVKLLNIQNKDDFDREQVKRKQLEMEALEKMKQAEQEELAKYIAEKNIRVKPTASGLYFIPKKQGKGAKAVDGKIAEIHYSAYFLDGNKLFSSYENTGESVCFEIGSGFEIMAIEEALKKMNAGSQATLIVPSALAYGAHGIKDLVPPYCPLIFELELVSVMDTAVYKSKMEKREKELIENYLKENNIKTPPDASGLYYVELKKGEGTAASQGKTVKVKYVGRFLNGNIFDSSDENGGPVEFRLGSGVAIKGWELGILKMNVGTRARLIIPSKLAFGNLYTGIIPPYTPLVYDIELLSVK